MIAQMTRAALEWEERNPLDDDGSPDPLPRRCEPRAAPRLRVDPKTLRGAGSGDETRRPS